MFDTAISILKGLKDGTTKAGELPIDLRRLAVQYLEEETDKTQEEMASILGVSRNTISLDLKANRDAAMQALAPVETEKYAQELIVTARQCQGRARKKGDVALMWKIECDLADRLGRMGLIFYKGEPINIHVGNKTETHVTNIAITDGAGLSAINDAIAREIAEIEVLKRLAPAENN